MRFEDPRILNVGIVLAEVICGLEMFSGRLMISGLVQRQRDIVVGFSRLGVFFGARHEVL